MDRHASKYPNVSSYNYCFGNPVIYIDPDGNAAFYMNSRGFWAEGVKVGVYIGNVAPMTDPYMELTMVRGALYHKNTTNLFSMVGNAINSAVGGSSDCFVNMKPYSVEDETYSDGMRMAAEFAVAGVAFKVIGGAVGQLLKNAGNSLWKITPFLRGFVYENMLNLKGSFSAKGITNFPTIDAFYNGVATSIKTLELTAKSYLNGNAVYNKLVGYIDELAGFSGREWAGEVVEGTAIKSRVLEVGIPKNATAGQVQQIENAVEYAASKGVQLNVRAVK